MTDVNAINARIAEVKAMAVALNNTVAKEGRDLNETEKVTYDSFLREINDNRAKLEAHAKLAKLPAKGHPGEFNFSALAGGNGDGGEDGIDTRFPFAGIADFLKDGSGGVRASLAEGSDLQFVIPSYEVDGFISAFPQVDPYAAAGASITNLPGPWTEGRVPFILAGDEPSVYSEGSGPSTDESAGIVVVKLNDPKKIAFLTKPTEEAMEDIDGLAAGLGQEGIRRVYNKANKALTTDLIASLLSANATVLSREDNYTDVLDLIGAIPSIFASSSNVFMMSRRSLALIRDTRAPGSGVPLFDATSAKLAGYSIVQNDWLPAGKVLFGSFFSAVHLRRTGLHFLQLNEAYREAGKVGLRFHQRADWAFFSEAANSSVVEQPLYMLTSDLGS